ncbi:hypothetical protein N7533_000451 [Penicillium manginii]|uniref:uncharacterized protein n=1 Tax=Penicillium manginii TaxID=203109 RepID=UPI002547D0E8|nr:uncharacterized protein N7533_000451 [Penicillium manginii]KAJ5767868.1 hypothetical protein N7533_000451 [Penicillium manginii]
MADNGDTPKKTPRKRAKKDSTLTPAKMADSSMESPTKRSKIAPTPLLPQGLDLSDADMKVLILALSCSEALKPDYDLLAQRGGYTKASAKVIFGKAKRKLAAHFAKEENGQNLESAGLAHPEVAENTGTVHPKEAQYPLDQEV